MGMHIGPHDPSVLLSAKVANITGVTNTITSYTDISGSAWRIYTFLESGTFTTDVLSKCDIFVLGAGGSGGGGNSSNYGSGGGSGGLLWRPAKILGSGTHTVAVGNGGTFASGDTNGDKGDDSSFSGGGYTLTGNGGGAGSGVANSTQPATATGGSGGGAGRDAGSQTPGQANQTNGQDSSATAYGNDGGVATGTGCTSAGGGGGTGQVGQNGGYDCQTSRASGQSEGGYGVNALAGMSNTEFIDFMWAAQAGTDTSQNYVGGQAVSGLGSKPSDIRIGGGGGGGYETDYIAQCANGGLGGGGRGGSRYPATSPDGLAGTDGLANTGGGGGAGQMYNASEALGGDGGSGIVIVRLGAL